MPDQIAPPAPPIPTRFIFRRLFKLLRPQWGMIAFGLILLLLSMPGDLFPGLVWMYVTDGLIFKKPTTSTHILHHLISFNGYLQTWRALLFSSLAWLFGVYLIAETFGTLSSNLMNRVAQRFILQFRNQVYQKLHNQSLAYLQRQRAGDLMSRTMGDVDQLQTFIVNGIDVIVGEGLLWIITVALVMALDWRVASVSLAPLLVVYLLLRVFNARIGPIYKATRDRAGDVSTRLQENLAGIVVIKIFGREKEEAVRFQDATVAQFTQELRGINARSLYFPFSRAVGFLSNVFMIGLGGYSILSGGSFTLGKLVAFRAYWWRLFGPIQTLARVNDMVQRAVAAGRRVFEVLDAPDEMPESHDAVEIEKVTGAVAFERVSFAYTTDAGTVGQDVLHDVSFRIEPGQTIALCGPSGAGKSTILNLLLRFYDPTSGQITLDVRDIRSIRRQSLRRHFSLVQQESFLFNERIIDNIRYGQPSATMAQVVAAAQTANAHEFIARLPAGYDTIVGERGVRLSGGQKQRISIARAFLANPSILVLDEPTSSVEPDSEAIIIAALDRLMAGRTTVLTSHRPSLVMQADIVHVIENGMVTDSGSPRELAGRNDWFMRFASSAGVDVSDLSRIASR